MKYILIIFFNFTFFFINAQTTISGSFEFQDSTRTYTIYIPQAYLDNSTEEVPLLLNLHGYGSINWQQELYGDFRPIADAENFIVCHPNGTIDQTGSRFWNVGFAASSIDDVGFLSALIDTINSKYNIDSEKVFSTGMSNGGFMSYKLACELPDKIKAVASVTGSMTPIQYNNCSNMDAIPALQIHGTSDPTVPYNGNATMKPIEEIVGFWVNQNDCDSTVIETSVPDNNTSDNATAIRYDFNSNCNGNSSVVFYKIENGGHTWPGAFNLPGNVTCQDFDASLVIWKFFCPESKFTNIEEPSVDPVLQELNVKLYPNPTSEYLNLVVKEDESLVNFKMYNQNGQLIKKGKKESIYVGNIEKGVYFIKIKTDKDFYNKMFVKD